MGLRFRVFVFVVDQFSYAKVHHFGLDLAGMINRNNDVAGFDVAMNDALAVSKGQRRQALGRDFQDGPFVKHYLRLVSLENPRFSLFGIRLELFPSGLKEFVERFSFDILHDQNRVALVLEPVEQCHNMRVRPQPRHNAAFVFEPFTDLRALKPLSPQHFQGNPAMQLEILGQVDTAHRALADAL